MCLYVQAKITALIKLVFKNYNLGIRKELRILLCSYTNKRVLLPLKIFANWSQAIF